jgi:hypothetical protein
MRFPRNFSSGAVVALNQKERHRFLNRDNLKLLRTMGEISVAQDEIEYLRAKARQFRTLADTYETGLSSKLREIAGQLEAHACNLEQRRELEAGGLRRASEEARLREQVSNALRLAKCRAEIGEGQIAAKLIEFAAELQVKCESLSSPANERRGRAARRAREFRLRAEEARTLAEGTNDGSAKAMLIISAESCERIATSLERYPSGAV